VEKNLFLAPADQILDFVREVVGVNLVVGQLGVDVVVQILGLDAVVAGVGRGRQYPCWVRRESVCNAIGDGEPGADGGRPEICTQPPGSRRGVGMKIT